MDYFVIDDIDYSKYINSLKVNTKTVYNAQTNAAGDTVADYINSKRTIEVGIIPLDKEAMIAYASVHAENVFDEVEVVLKDFPDVMICVSVLDEDDEIYYLEIDREVQFNWYDEILYDEYFLCVNKRRNEK